MANLPYSKDEERKIDWARRTLEEIRDYPAPVTSTFGFGLHKAQLSERHEGASPMKGRLAGVVELKENHDGDTYRVYYTLKCPEWVYVLYTHKKKSKRGSRIPKKEEDTIVRRYKDALEDCKEKRGTKR